MSQRAEDLSLELDVLRQRRRDEARAAGIPERSIVERVATLATGTRWRTHHLPDLLALSAAYTDVVTRDQVPVAPPALRHGQRHTIITFLPLGGVVRQPRPPCGGAVRLS